ncbi:hypothetical protein [Elizabethkingia ursingii]
MKNRFNTIKELSKKEIKLGNAKHINFISISQEFQNLIDTQNKINSIFSKIHFKNLIPTFNFPDYKYLLPSFSDSVFNNLKLFDSLKKISEIGKKISNNPEAQFAFITDLEILNIKSTEE